MVSSYDIVPYQPEFKPQVLELQTELWSPSVELNRAYFDWKHERNPYLSPSLLYLALHQGKVVGMRSFFGVRWEAGAPRQTLTGLYADDMVIAPDHRNRGLMRRIMEGAFKDLTRRGYEYLFNLSAGPVTFTSSLSIGWRSPGFMQPMRWRSWRLARNMGVRRIAKRFPVLSRGLGRFPAAKPGEGFPSLAETDPSQVARYFEKTPSVSFAFEARVAAMAALVERIGSDGRIRHVRDRRYLEWRFQNPLRRYGFLFCGQEGLEGYLVLQEYTVPSRDPEGLNIVDWEATSAGVLNRLLEAACQVARSRKLLHIWSATLSRERLAALTHSGFRAVKENPGPGLDRCGLLVRALAEDRPAPEWLFAGRRLVDLAEWDLRMLYSMHG